MDVLLVSNSDIGGGAEISAWNLFKALRSRGHRSFLAVGRKRTDDPDVLRIPGDSSRNLWARFWLHAAYRLKPSKDEPRTMTRSRDFLRWIAEPGRRLARARGREDFNYPGTWQLLKLCARPDIIHCYNLHQNYFDLRALAWLSRQRPVILDLRDAWLLSGHCAHSLDCERWKTGCGRCPDLKLYPAIRRDATAYNWRRKKEIFAKSRLYVATPSQWLMDKVRQSILAPAIVESRIVPTGIDLSVFHPSERRSVRASLDIPQDTKALLFSGNGIRRNMWKDYQTMGNAIALVAGRLSAQKILFIALGEDAPPERIGEASVRFVPHQKSPEAVARYYQAADLYVHAATADTFPRSVLEALACGTPVIATGVGGIPEQIKSLDATVSSAANHATGIIVPAGDSQGMAAGIEKLLTNELLHFRLGENAAKDARERFDLQKQADCYLEWYQQLLQGTPGY